MCTGAQAPNAAPLRAVPQEKEPKLPSLLKLLVWAQQALDERAAYPRIQDLSTAELVPPPPAAAGDD